MRVLPCSPFNTPIGRRLQLSSWNLVCVEIRNVLEVFDQRLELVEPGDNGFRIQTAHGLVLE